MHAPSLLTNVGVSDPAASSSEARTPELAKPRLPEAGGGGEGGGCGKWVVAAGPGPLPRNAGREVSYGHSATPTPA